jgi:hypothetical protein
MAHRRAGVGRVQGRRSVLECSRIRSSRSGCRTCQSRGGQGWRRSWPRELPFERRRLDDDAFGRARRQRYRRRGRSSWFIEARVVRREPIGGLTAEVTAPVSEWIDLPDHVCCEHRLLFGVLVGHDGLVLHPPYMKGRNSALNKDPSP